MNKFNLLKYAIDYLSKYSANKKHLEKILKAKIIRFTKNKKPQVLELEVYKDTPYPAKKEDKPNAVAYLNGREEQEIIVYNYSSSEFITMPPWDHSIHQEFYIEEMLNGKR